MPTAATAASVKSGADPASVTTKTTKLGQELNSGVKGQPAETPSNQAAKPARAETRPSAPVSNSSGKPEVGQPVPVGVPDTPAPPIGSSQPATVPADAKPSSALSPDLQVKGDQITSTSPSGQSAKDEPTGPVRSQPMTQSPKTPEPPVGRAEFATSTPASAAASGTPPSIGQQAAPSITSEGMPTSAATPPASFGQALRSDQPTPSPAQPETPGHQSAAPVTQPPPAMTPANPQPVSPRTAPPASSSTNQPVRPMPDRSSPVGSQASPPIPIGHRRAPETPRAPDAAVPTAGSASNAPASSTPAPLPPEDPPTRKADAGQQQKTASKVTSASNRREPLKSPRQTGGQS
jgi:hypothetical protein